MLNWVLGMKLPAVKLIFPSAYPLSRVMVRVYVVVEPSSAVTVTVMELAPSTRATLHPLCRRVVILRWRHRNGGVVARGLRRHRDRVDLVVHSGCVGRCP